MAHPGRTPKACDACRLKKSRCVISPGQTACEGCLVKHIECSIQRQSREVRGSQNSEATPVSESPISSLISPSANIQDSAVFSEDVVMNFQSVPTEQKPGNAAHIWHPKYDGPPLVYPGFHYHMSPASITMRDRDGSSLRFGVYSQLSRGPALSPSDLNVISANILSEKQVYDLLSFFRSNFNHWISLPSLSTPEELVKHYLQSCPLVLSACCAVAMRFGKQEVFQTIYPSLSKFLKYHVDSIALNGVQSIELVQALTVISLFASSLSYGDSQFDPWMISGVGIMHMETLRSLNVPFTHLHFRLWNHLNLAHYGAANISGRRVLIGKKEEALAQEILQDPDANRFDSSVVAQVSVHIIAHSYFRSETDFAEFSGKISDWYSQWSYLARQPIIQFIEPVYQYILFVARIMHVCRVNNVPVEDCISHNLLGSVLFFMSPQELRSLIVDLNMVVESLLDVVHEAFFPCLSDELHIMGFNAACFTNLLLHELYRRGEPLEPDAIVLARRLAERFSITSPGKGTISYEWAKVLTDISAPF